ncbi:hypothetical protein D3C83_189520 [compost metagenome]
MPVERAKDAVNGANVRVVRIRIHDKCYARLRMLVEPDLVREVAEIKKLGIPEEKQALGGIQPAAGSDFPDYAL